MSCDIGLFYNAVQDSMLFRAHRTSSYGEDPWTTMLGRKRFIVTGVAKRVLSSSKEDSEARR